MAKAHIRQLIVAGLIGLVVYNLFLLNDALARPGVLDVALFWRLGVLTPYGLVALALVKRGLSAQRREAVMVSTVLALLIALVFMSHLSVMRDSARMFAMGQLLGTAVFTLVAGYRIERSTRQSYLLMLREEIRSEAANRSAQEFALASRTDALTGLATLRAMNACVGWQRPCAGRFAMAICWPAWVAKSSCCCCRAHRWRPCRLRPSGCASAWKTWACPTTARATRRWSPSACARRWPKPHRRWMSTA